MKDFFLLEKQPNFFTVYYGDGAVLGSRLDQKSARVLVGALNNFILMTSDEPAIDPKLMAEMFLKDVEALKRR